MYEQIEKIKEILLGVWGKKHYILIATWIICPVGWLAVSALPDKYEATAQVYVDTQSLLRPLMEGLMVETDPDYQVRLMVKTLLGRPNLTKIARMTDLDLQAEDSEEFEAIIEDLKTNMTIEPVGKENIFNISYEGKDPLIAKNIVQAALTVFIENTLGETRSDTDTAQKFLDKQIRDYENRLVAAEKRLTEFKKRYTGVLPTNNGGFYSALNAAKNRLRETNLQLMEAQGRLESARGQLSQEDLSSGQALSENILDNDSIATTYDERIQGLKTNLDTALISYTEKHPDVIEIRRRLDELSRLRKEEIEAYYLALTTESEDGESVNLSAANASPVYQEMRILVNQIENEIASLQVRANNYQSQVDELTEKIRTIPDIEAELVALNRGYEINKSKYEELLSRKETALMAKQADATSDKIQFRVIDPPQVPSEPSGPYRIIFYLAVLVVGVGAGAGAAFMMTQANPVVVSSNQLSRALNMPVMGVVTAASSIGLVDKEKRKTRMFIISNVLLLVLLAGFIGYSTSSQAPQTQQTKVY
ncbi:XrtA system polysaccharide chain length determinant [Thalassotalea sp. PS06]|uniref:XrtA system polysaccharide chain length determinant n=1 Tax=Thalassotalea sp. PS06 TaxID=2594005 RepID=UPI001163F46C|nr:XrtA system polysaccharide chain length determinant [Thalassotalea sp. PS06]QDO99966.1 chain length determinant family protein [Thalassotalea sp. PS06]